MRELLIRLWLSLVGNPAAMRFEDGSLLPGFAFAKDNKKRGLVLRQLFALKVVFPVAAPARLTKPGNIVEFLIDGAVVATGRARRLFTDNMTFTCRDIREIQVGALKTLLEHPAPNVRISGIEEGIVSIHQVDEIEHPINSPIAAFIKRGDVTAFEIKYLSPRERFDAFYQIWLLHKDTGMICLHGDFKGKRLFVYVAKPEMWAFVLGGQWGTVDWLFKQKNLCKVLKLMLTPTRATFATTGDARVYIGAVSGKDGPIFFAHGIRHERLDNGNCQTRTNPNLCGLGCKGLGLSNRNEWLTECAYYGIDPEAYDVIINEDAIKINALGVKPGDTISLPWSVFRMINLNLRRGSGHIGRQIVVMPPDDAEDVLVELGLMDRAMQFVELCKWDWRAWMRVCSSINDSKMEDNFFHAFLNLQPDAEDWVIPQDQTTLTRAKARLEIAWNDLLIKLPFGNRSVQIGYDSICDASEEAYLAEHGNERHFAILGKEYKKEIEEFGCVAVATFPMVNDKGLLTVYPCLDDEGHIIWGPKGMVKLSKRFCAKKYRDGDGDKAAIKGLKKILEFPWIEVVDESEDPKMIVDTIAACNAKVLVQAQASWGSAVNVGIEDLTCSYVAMSLHRQGIRLTPEEQSDMGFRREVEGLHLLKHSTGAGKGIETDPAKIMLELVQRFGKGRVKLPSERQRLYFWVDRHDAKKARYASSKKAIAAMDKSFNRNNPGEVDHFLVTKGANILAAPSVRIMHRLCNLLPAMFHGITTPEALIERCKGNPYGRAMALLYVNSVGSYMTPKAKHADAISAKNSVSWAWQVALEQVGASMLSGKGYTWNLATVKEAAVKLDAFYSEAATAINTEYKSSQDWQGRVLRKHIQYSDLFRAIRYMLDGRHPGYEELYNCPQQVIFKHMGTSADPGIIYILPVFISGMPEEERMHFLTMLSIAVGVEGWGLSGKKNRKSGGVTRLMPFEPSVMAEIEYAKYQVQLMTSKGLTMPSILPAINPVIRKYIDPDYDDGNKLDILALGKGFDERRKAHDEQISDGYKEDEVPSVDPTSDDNDQPDDPDMQWEDELTSED